MLDVLLLDQDLDTQGEKLADHREEEEVEVSLCSSLVVFRCSSQLDV